MLFSTKRIKHDTTRSGIECGFDGLLSARTLRCFICNRFDHCAIYCRVQLEGR